MAKKQISLDGLIGKNVVVSFNETDVYIREGDVEKTVPVVDVLSLSKTGTALNNRYFWRLEYRSVAGTETVDFRPNVTLWNRQFLQFHARLAAVNPAAVRSPCRWWNL